MDILFTPIEIRVLGSLMEKEHTTPEYYPMTLNSIRLACNQKSSREPVMNLDETEVEAALNELTEKGFVRRVSVAGARALKYKQLLTERISLSPAETAVLCLLFIRGAQTVGELRHRSSRIHKFNDIAEVEQTLQHLTDREDGPFVLKLPREAGLKERRYAHLFSGEPDVSNEAESEDFDENSVESIKARIAILEEEIKALREEFQKYKLANNK